MESNNIEKNIQGKLKDYENFDGDKMAMWAAIDEGLGKKKKRRGFIFWFCLGGLALIVGFLSLVFWMKGLPETTAELNLDNTETPALSTDEKTNRDSPETAAAITTDVADATELNLQTQQSINQIEVADKKEGRLLTEKKAAEVNIKKIEKERSDSKAPVIRNNQVVGNLAIAKKSIDENIASDLKELKLAGRGEENNRLNNSLDKKPKTTPTTVNESAVLLQDLEGPSLVADSVIAQGAFELVDLLSVPPPSTTGSMKWSINVAGGISKHVSNYQSHTEYSDLRNDSESNLQGGQVQLELAYHFNRNISLITGMEYSRSWTRFEFNEEQTETSILENVLNTYHINTYWFQNDTILEYGEAMIATQIKREVQHHNRYDRIQVPLLIAKTFEKGRFSLACQTGLGLDIWMHRSGKVLNSDSFIRTFNQNGSSEYNKLGLSAKLRFNLGLALSDQLGFYLQPSGNLSLSDWTTSGDELTQKPFVYGVNLGLTFKLQ